MKYLSKFILWFFITAFSAPLLIAQNSIDANRMNRDISIMENILQEMFKTRWESSGSSVHIAPSGAFGFRGKAIRGTYLPDYGVIFTVPGQSPGFMIWGNREDGNSFSYSFHYSDDESSQKEVNEESITRRIKEFLREYGSTIGQLENGDRIMVIYNTRQPRREMAFFEAGGEDQKKVSVPTISVVAEISDLKAYRSGSIDESELDDRLSVSTVSADSRDQLDLKVMANIFETALNEKEEKGFRTRGSINYLNLDNFGALFFFDARFTSASGSLLFDFPGIASFSLGEGEEEERARVEVQSVIRERMKEAKQKQQETAEEIRASYDTFIADVKEYLVDYGRTLGSVSSNQHIMVSITLSSSIDDIPERVDLQVRKSVLEAMDKEDMSRGNAMEEVVVREY
ncbi:MAG: hypothetical protein GVY02_06705 [Bacteroidetes bacterium]|jgi:hypothetical protein|nr:hypothetical protein [Bacteroidota bacterium]